MKEIWLAFKAAIIRFWDNRFNGYSTVITPEQDQIAYLKIQLEKTQEFSKSLIDVLNNPKQDPITTQNEVPNYMPIQTGGFTSWSQKQRQLERNSRQQAIQLAEEARKKLALERARATPTEELERELGITVE